jgi:hypothetical protein
MPLPQTGASLIDALGQIRRTIADLQRREKELTGRVGRLGVGYHAGRLYTATVSGVFSERGGVDVTVKRNEDVPRRPSGRARAAHR